jgi:hypothetical protein
MIKSHNMSHIAMNEVGSLRPRDQTGNLFWVLNKQKYQKGVVSVLAEAI